MANLSIATALRGVIRNLEQTKERFQLVMQERKGDQLAARTLARLKTEPGKPNYPIRWTSEKQRRAFFATKGFGRGIPASRSNPSVVLEGWDAEFIPTPDGGILAITNDVPHMKYVQGDLAQGFHRDTGYVQLEDVIEDGFREMEGVAVQGFFEAADPLEGL
jgi:hypothetical protein